MSLTEFNHMRNTRRCRKSVGLGSHHLGEWSHSMMDKQMLDRVEMLEMERL